MRSQVQRVIEHLLKLEYSPAEESRLDWRGSVDQARDELRDDLTASLRRDIGADLETFYGRARREAARAMTKHGERDAADALPATCPYDFDQIVDREWSPPNRHGLDDPAV